MDPFVKAPGKLALIQTGKQPHPLPQRPAEIQLALHRALGDPRDLVLEPGIIGELVDAFLADDRRIHVGDEQPAPARLIRLDDHIDLDQPTTAAHRAAFRSP